MRTFAAMVALVVLGGTANAQVVSAGVTVAAPSISFEVAPPLVSVGPGVQVVEGYDQEVFFTGGWYWCRRDGVWFRTRDYHGGWIVAPRRYVPGRLVRIPPGHYRNYHYAGPRGPRYHEVRYHEMRRHEARSYGRPVTYARPVAVAHGHGRH